MKPPKLKYRDLMHAIVGEWSLFLQHFQDEDKYQRILGVLKQHLETYDNAPYQKDLLKQLNITRDALMVLLNDLYRDFKMALCNDERYPISKTLIFLIIRTLNDHWVIGLNGLKLLPRVGDRFDISFVKDEIGGSLCQVTSIDHELDGGIHTVNIYLDDCLLLRENGKQASS